MLLKNEIIETIKKDSDAFNLGMRAKRNGISIEMNPFKDTDKIMFEVYWNLGWNHKKS